LVSVGFNTNFIDSFYAFFVITISFGNKFNVMRIVSRVSVSVWMVLAAVGGAFAQVPPPGGPITAEAPLDAVVILLLIAALIYGVRLINQSKAVPVEK